MICAVNSRFFFPIAIALLLSGCTTRERGGLPENKRNYSSIPYNERHVVPSGAYVQFSTLDADTTFTVLNKELTRLFGRGMKTNVIKRWLKDYYFSADNHNSTQYAIADRFDPRRFIAEPDCFTYFEFPDETVMLQMIACIRTPLGTEGTYGYKLRTGGNSVETTINKIRFTGHLRIDVEYRPNTLFNNRPENYSIIIPDTLLMYTVFDEDSYR